MKKDIPYVCKRHNKLKKLYIYIYSLKKTHPEKYLEKIIYHVKKERRGNAQLVTKYCV